MKHKKFSPGDVQQYLTAGAIVLPNLEAEYLTFLYNMSRRGQVSLTPLALLQYYNNKIQILTTQKETHRAKRQSRGR